MRPKLQKQSALKLAVRIILHKQGMIPRSKLAEIGCKACFEVHTRDLPPENKFSQTLCLNIYTSITILYRNVAEKLMVQKRYRGNHDQPYRF